MKLYRHSNSDVIWFRIDGKRKSSQTVIGEKLYWDNDEHLRIAKKLCRKASDNQILQKIGGIIDELPEIALEHAFSVYFNVDKKHRSENTREVASTSIESFIEFCQAQGVKYTSGIDRALLRAFIAHLAEDRKASTVNTYYAQIKTWLKFCSKEGWVRDIDYPDPLPEGDKEIDIMSRSEYRKYLCEAASGGPVEKYLRISPFVIARVRELLGIRKKDIDLQEGILKIHRKKTKEHQRYPITAKMKEIFLEYIPDKPKDRIIGVGYPLFYKRWRKAFKDIDPYYPPKVMRATAESWLLQKSGNIKLAARLAGHNISTAEKHYLKYGIDNLRAEIEEFHRFGIDADDTSPGTVSAHPEK